MDGQRASMTTRWALALAFLLAASHPVQALAAGQQPGQPSAAVAGVASPERLSFRFDFGLARMVCKMISTGDFNSTAVVELKAHPAMPAMVRKMRLKDADAFIAHLQALAKNPKVVEATARMLPELSKETSGKWAPLAALVTGQLKEYVPADFAAKLNVYFIFGSGSGGFAFDDVPDDVYVTITEAPMLDMAEVVAHELFHAVQTHVMPAPPRTDSLGPASGPIWLRRLLYDLVQESTAELFTHPVVDRPVDVVPNPSQPRWEKNKRRMRSLPLLFETIGWRLLLAPPANEDAYDGIYGFLFYGNHDSPAYDLGWVMAKTIESKEGKAAIYALLKDDPKQFVLRYQALAAGDASLPKFSEEFIARLKAL